MLVGVNYKSERNLVDVAKDIRMDLKSTFGKAWKFSVRISRFSMGQSIDVEIKAAPCSLFRWVGEHEREMTKAYRLAIDTAAEILDSYNRQDIDSQSDYYNVSFYGHVQVCSELRQRQLNATAKGED